MEWVGNIALIFSLDHVCVCVYGEGFIVGNIRVTQHECEHNNKYASE